MGYRHFGHREHPLVICSTADCKQVPCAGCADECTGLTYGCEECRFYVHYSCLRFPEEILHPTHPAHSLVPKPVSADFTCSACRHSRSNRFYFLCQEPSCNFAIDIKCAFPLPAINYPDHGHPLYFFDELPEDVEHRECEACGEPCRSSVLACLDLDCKFRVHLVCERPPCLFKHEFWLMVRCFHCRSEKGLQAKASIDEVDVHRRRCRYCSKEMGPQTPLYYCEFCKSIAHVKCIFSRVDRDEDVQMNRTETKQDGRKEGNSESKEAAMQRGETFGVMVNSLNETEEAELEDVYKRRVVEIIRVLAWRNDNRFSPDGVLSSPFMDKAFSEFTKRLPRGIRRISSLAVASEGERVVQVAEYKMTKKLAPVLRELFMIHGDVSEESTLTVNPKIVVFIILCGTIYSMADTRVAEVTEELLYNWWKYLMFVHFSRFKIKFAIDRLKLVMRAHYTNLQHDNNAILRTAKEIRELSQEIEESKSKLDRLTDEQEWMLEDEHGSMLNLTDDLVEACSKNARAWKY